MVSGSGRSCLLNDSDSSKFAPRYSYQPSTAVGKSQRFVESRRSSFQGDPSDAVFCLLKGKVRLSVVSSIEKESHHFDESDFFGESCLGAQFTGCVPQPNPSSELAITAGDRNKLLGLLSMSDLGFGDEHQGKTGFYSIVSECERVFSGVERKK
jgi:hypothetical protein